MTHKEIETNAYNIHFIKTNKFKTILFKLIFRDDIKKEDITIRNMMLDNLLATTKKYNTVKKMTIARQNLYGLDLYGSNKRVGNQFFTEITMSVLNPKYTEEIMLEESLKFLNEILFNPNTVNNEFEKENYNIVKKTTISNFKRYDENSSTVVIRNLKENVSENEPFSYRMEGYIEDIPKINEKKLYDYYKKFLNDSLLDIYVVGNFSAAEMERLLKKYIKINSIKKSKEKIELSYKTTSKEKNITKESDFVQSKIAIAATFKESNIKEKQYIIPLYNIILGNSPDSKLFKNVREKNSLAYSVSSGYRRLDNLMIISAGISANNYNETILAIKKEIKEITKGNFTTEDINKAKELFISVLKDLYDYQSSIIDYYFNIEYLEGNTIEEEKTIINSITKEELLSVSKKIVIDTVYFLKEKTYENSKY